VKNDQDYSRPVFARYDEVPADADWRGVAPGAHFAASADHFSIFPIVDTMKKVPFFARSAVARISGKHFTNFHV
jgi:hypothetical protein